MYDSNWILDNFNLMEIRLTDEALYPRIKNTLRRMGIANKDERKLWQSCHILMVESNGNPTRYFLLHFKELFAIDQGDVDFQNNTFDDADQDRRNDIAAYLTEWGQIEVLNVEDPEFAPVCSNFFVTLRVGEVAEDGWELIPKYFGDLS
jgi:hypothetical protein